MSSYYAAYYGSGLRLKKKEFKNFVEQYMKVTKETKRSMVNRVLRTIDEERFIDDEKVNEIFDQMVTSEEIVFTWGADAGSNTTHKRFFNPIVVSPDCSSDGMHFQRYYANGKPNVFFTDREKEIKNPDYVGAILLRNKTSYVFYSDHALDSVEAFEERPYRSYQEFRQEFQDKMAAYLPDDFDWDAHIGIFNYAQYA